MSIHSVSNPAQPQDRIYLLIYSSLEKRKAEAERIRQKYPDRIPVRSDFSI
jgi:hypothetical protein